MPQDVAEDGTMSNVYPFLVHCRDSMTNGKAPRVDDAKLARQKRRRTSREDQATLEAEYNRDPKPDKRARLAIVNVVSLGEKEVQIWFQNRRQNTRRRSRPLLPHEIVAFGLDDVVPPLPDESSGQGSSQSSYMENSSSQPVSDQHRASFVGLRGALSPLTRSSSLPMDPAAAPPAGKISSVSDADDVPESAAACPILSSVTHVGYLANRRNNAQGSGCLSTSPSTVVELFRSSPFTVETTASSQPSLTTSSSSKIRLSMSLDGKAELVARGTSPPLPKLVRSSSAGSTRARQAVNEYSASRDRLCLDPLPSPSVPKSICLIPRLSQGRSRDARTWEFCCDADTQDELTAHAQHESSGSAVAAISLLRSTNHKASKPGNEKHKLMNRQPVIKRAKMGRAQSSLARLQGESSTTLEKASRKDVSPAMAPSTMGDSDKENWSPNRSSVDGPLDRDSSRTHITNARTQSMMREIHVAGQKRSSTLAETARNRRASPENHANKDFSDVACTEVASFMKGEISPGKRGDFDCVQGLLSLSQGNWR